MELMGEVVLFLGAMVNIPQVRASVKERRPKYVGNDLSCPQADLFHLSEVMLSKSMLPTGCTLPIIERIPFVVNPLITTMQV